MTSDKWLRKSLVPSLARAMLRLVLFEYWTLHLPGRKSERAVSRIGETRYGLAGSDGDSAADAFMLAELGDELVTPAFCICLTLSRCSSLST